jgi:hypothetical protein
MTSLTALFVVAMMLLVIAATRRGDKGDGRNYYSDSSDWSAKVASCEGTRNIPSTTTLASFPTTEVTGIVAAIEFHRDFV